MSSHIERERKFLVHEHLLPNLNDKMIERCEIEQGYLSFEPEVRVRVVRDPDGSMRRSNITIKLPYPVQGEEALVRKEFQIPLPSYEAVETLKAVSLKVKKTRYIILDEILDLRWELDHFHAFGTYLVEVEFPTPDVALKSLPPWVAQEVTKDGRYSNASIATNGWPGFVQQPARL